MLGWARFGDDPAQEARHQAVERADLALMGRVAEGEVVAKPSGERERLLYAEAFGYGHESGQGVIWHFPFRVEGQVRGASCWRSPGRRLRLSTTPA